MKSFLSKSLIAIAVLSLVSCSSTRTFDFRKAYKFGYYNYQKQVTELPPEHGLPYASLRSKIHPLDRMPIEPESGVLNAAPSKFIREINRANLKKFKREVREEIKKIDSEIKNLKKENKSTSVKEQNAYKKSIKELKKEKKSAQKVNQKIFIGIVIGAAGLILLIIGVAEIVGVLAVVAGLGLIVWGFIEKGSF